MCIHTKNKRIRRHDKIKNFIAQKASKRTSVFVEPAVMVTGELKKPDLVIKDQERLWVVEVTVRYEDRANLAEAYREKQKVH